MEPVELNSDNGIGRLLRAEEQAREIVQRAVEEGRQLRRNLQAEVDAAVAEYKAEVEQYGRSPEVLAVKAKYRLSWEQFFEIVQSSSRPNRWVEIIERHFTRRQ